jgi:hypothetical protein
MVFYLSNSKIYNFYEISIKMMTKLLDDVISNVLLYSQGCSKFLEYDGISSRIFLLKGFDNIKLIYFKDVQLLRKKVPTAGLALTLVKNFDEYQYIICNYVPNLSDNNIYKIKFQKIRILVFLFFYKLSKILESATETNVLDAWIKEANSFLLEISQIILDYRESLQKHNNENLKTNIVSNDKYKLKRDYYNYFNIEEGKIDKIIFSTYGI